MNWLRAVELIRKNCELNSAQSKDRTAEATTKTIRLLTFAERAYREYENGSVRKKREIVHDLSSNLTLLDQKLEIKTEESLQLLLESTTEMPFLKSAFEPGKNRTSKEKSTSIGEMRSSWLSIVDEFRTANWVKIENELTFSGTLTLFPSPSI